MPGEGIAAFYTGGGVRDIAMKVSGFGVWLRYWLRIGLAPGIIAILFWINLSKTAVVAQAPRAAIAAFDLNADLQNPDQFYNLPYPSDLRLDADGKPDLSGFPVFKRPYGLVRRLKPIASDRPGFPTTAAGYFRFDQPLAPLDIDQLIPAAVDAPILLIDIGRNSPERGRLYPVAAATPEPDPFYVPDYLLAVSPFPGIVLKPNRQYAYVVRRSLKDANGQALQATKVFAELRKGEIPKGLIRRKFRADLMYRPLWETLDLLGIDREDVVVATVFTTGDVVAEMAQLSDQVLERYQPDIQSIEFDPTHIISDLDYCKFTAEVTLPQFQKGDPPYFLYKRREGVFEFDPAGNLKHQRFQTIPLIITLPKTAMPPEGYPLAMYFHGSGGLSTQVVNRGPVPRLGRPRLPDRGPADVVARHGLAAVGSALPLNPERLPGIYSDIFDDRPYLNPLNLSAYRDTFRQGVIEQRLLLEALGRVRISSEAIEGCTGPTLPAGETHFRLQTESAIALGQSQGAQYAVMMAAVEPKIQAVVPTGSGGFWALLFSTLARSENPNNLQDVARLLGRVLQRSEPLDHLYPALRLIQSSWEAAEPMVYMPRIAQRPLPNHPVRSIYQPVGLGDSDFPEEVFNAVALASGVQQAGPILWREMQDSLALGGLEGILPYPVSQNLVSETGIPYTGIVVQYEGDGLADPHTIFSQRTDVKYQYGCFMESIQQAGMGVVLEPRPILPPCRFP